MKIAYGQVNSHFGHSSEIIVFETDGRQVTGNKTVNNEDCNQTMKAWLVFCEMME